jgi:hypothetical protein
MSLRAVNWRKYMRNRAWRRKQNHLKEEKAYRKLTQTSWWFIQDTKEEKLIEARKQAKTLRDHMKSCSCFMCGNARRHWNQKTLQEIKFEDIVRSQDTE